MTTSSRRFFSLQRSYSKKPAESNLRTYLDAVNNPDRIKDNDLADILVLLRDDQLAEVDAMEVLKCCSSKHVRHSQVLDDIWTELRSKPGRLDLHHYDALLRIFISKNKIFSPHAIFDEIIAQGLTPRMYAKMSNMLIGPCLSNTRFLFFQFNVQLVDFELRATGCRERCVQFVGAHAAP